MAPREDEKAMDGLLRRNLARGADSAGVCPDPGILAAYFERSLDADETERHELHFSQCARCREQLAAMARASAPAGAGAGSSPATSPRLWFWDWRWLAVPAAAMLAFAIVGFLHERSVKDIARQAPAAPAVALEKPAAAPSGELDLKSDEEKSHPALTAPAQNPAATVSRGVPKRAAPAESQNAMRLKPSFIAPRSDPAAAAKSQSTDMLTHALDKSAARKEPLPASNKVEAPPSMSEAVEVTSAAPAVKSPAPPQPLISAREVGGNTSGANTGVGGATTGANASVASAAPGATAANAQELESVSPRKKLKQKDDSGAAQAEITSSMNDSAQLVAGAGQLSSQTILTPNPQILWRFAGSGFVERSTDGGATWQGEEPSAGGQLVAGAAPSANVCWIVGRGGLILLTKDAKSWKKIEPPVDTDFIAVSAESAPNATVTTADGRKFATKDGGKKWKATENAATPPQN